ncbi:MAG: peptidyl-prolyl cis-trans isomerase [Tannerellaceae bacterium]|jgi:hypothetical protein|nr:peptidyl-prolyl cis-trans isomerase [Tannerellaceae bacterium]
MQKKVLLISFLLLLCACREGRDNGDTEVLATVGEKVLKRSDVTLLIPKGISSSDSLFMAEGFIKKWVKDALVYDVALNNLGNEKAEINKLVEDYRESLVRYRYQERLLRERLTADIRESDKLNYYEENQKKFILDKSLIKGLFLKIPADAPGISDVRSWYKQTNVETLEKIEKYSVQNATLYDYFYDRWVDFDAIMENIPLHVSDPNAFLKANKFVEEADSSYIYLLNISEYLPSGSVEPYDYANTGIMEMLINQRKVDFIRKFEEDLYNDAIRKGKAKVISEP